LSTLPDWARALGPALFACQIRATPSDFIVDEQMDVEFSDDGEHDWLHVEKTSTNTHWLAEQLAKYAGITTRDVGYAGLKDRHAITRQWFSVRRPTGDGTDWTSFEADGVRIVEQRLHRRKLKRGAHRGNAFRIALRADDIVQYEASIAERLAEIGTGGVPNYFGEQRFGRGGANVELGRAIVAGCRMSRNKRSIGISAVRSLDFNDELSARVIEGTWNRILPGDVANLDGSGSIFDVEEVTPDLEQRCAELDIHPCGSLPAFEAIGVESGKRPLRIRVRNMKWKIDEDTLWLEFSLGRGCYATAVLREIVRHDAVSGRSGDGLTRDCS
jgi:tRNA pseudouridine13 synthase